MPPHTHYAHSRQDRPKSEWEPLFTPYGEADNQCQRHTCKKCAEMTPNHGHLNKVAYWTAQFASSFSKINEFKGFIHLIFKA
jgi:hypothetical protein